MQNTTQGYRPNIKTTSVESIFQIKIQHGNLHFQEEKQSLTDNQKSLTAKILKCVSEAS